MKLVVELGVLFIMLCAGVALAVGVTHAALSPLAARLTASWRSRLRMLGLLAPVLSGMSGVIIALAPALLHVLGLAQDHCLSSGEHAHAHLCFIHPASGVSTLLAATVAAFALLVLVRMARVAARWRRTSREFAAVLATCSVDDLGGGAYLLDSEVPLCVTAGLIRPRIYISGGAAAALGPECTEAALSHERGHVARHDTRLRLLMGLLEVFHLPVLGRAMLQGWQDDSELLCDRFAARHVGSPTLVATALVRFQRAVLLSQSSSAFSQACLGGSGLALDTRIAQLLATDTLEGDGFDEATLAYVLGLALLVVGLAIQARSLHHVLEGLVGALTAM